MSTQPPEDQQPRPTGDDTAAFQRFYLEGRDDPPRGVLYRLFVGWWRDR